MNSRTIIFIKNMSYTIVSNFISLIVSTLIVLIIPKLIGVEEYGYWQLYIFYSAYVGFLHFGWNDGIYLRLGGERYEDLDKELLYSQYIQLLVFQLVIAILIWNFAIFFVQDLTTAFIVKMVSLLTIIMNIRLMFVYVLQATNRIKEYAKINLLDRLIYVILILFFLLFRVTDFKIMVLADLISRAISLVFLLISCKEIVFNKANVFRLTVSETVKNINAGIKLMFANIASMLIIGIVRFGIESQWGVAKFGEVSLTLSITNMMMIFINAIGIIVFPVLRRVDKNELGKLYCTIKDILTVVLLGSLIVYYPLKVAISSWLPSYSDSLLYMAIIFPVFFYEGKMALLVNTYLKTLRKENMMLKINLACMIMSLIFTYISISLFENLNITVLAITFLLATRSIVAEIYLARELKLEINSDKVLEVSVVIIFIYTGWFINTWLTTVIYTVSFFLYLLIKKKDLIKSLSNLKDYVRI